MKWIIDNWSLLIVIIAAFICGFIYIKKFTSMPTEQQVTQVKEWLLFAVIQAEKEFGSGTGALKLRYVYDAFVTTFPDIAKIVTFELFAKWVDDVLEYMHQIINTNLDIKSYVEDN